MTYNNVALKPSGATYVGWVVGDSGKILKTTDGGATWQQQNSGQSLSLRRIYALDENHAWVTTNTSTLLRTTNGGTTWQALTLQLGQNIQSVCFSDANNGFAAYGSNSILSSSDGGASWNPVFTGQATTWHKKYLVCRLDGYQEPADVNGLPLDIKRMIDNACDPDATGRFILDDRYPGSETWLSSANSTLTMMKSNGAAGIEEIKYDAAPQFLTDEQRVMGYASWGSNNGLSASNTQYAKPRNSWQKGSISTTYVSTCARTLNYPPDYANPVPTLSSSLAPAGLLQLSGCWQGWTGILHNNDTGQEVVATSNSYGFLDFPLTEAITNGYLKVFHPDGSEVTTARIIAPASSLAPRNKYSIGYQSLIADLFREGCDASIGNVTEPYFPACGQPQYLFPRYASGYTWAESAYMAMERAGWQETAVGDPLMAAYATPPVVAMSSPNADGLSISGTAYNVTATATPVNAPGINRVEFWLSNGSGVDALLGTVTTAPYSITFNTTALPAPYNQTIPDGRYVLEAVAYEDTNVRECGRFSRPVIINNGGSPATVNITSPAVDGTTLSNMATIAVSANPSTPPATSKVDLWLHNAKRDMLIGSIPAGMPYNFQFDTTRVPAGSYTLQAVAYSTTGQASASSIRQVNIDNSALIQITEPSTDGQQKSGKFTMTASTDPNASIAHVDFWLGQGSDRGVLVASDVTSPYSYDIDSNTFANGNYVIRAFAYDAANNLLGASLPRTVIINNAALLAFAVPATDGQTVSGNISVQVTAGTSDPVVNRVDLWTYSNSNWSITSTNTASPFNWSLDTTTLPNGSYTMKAVGYKLGGGRVFDSPTRTITVNNPNLLSITSPVTDGTIVSGTTTIVIGAQTTTPDYGRIEIKLTGKTTSTTFDITSRPFEYSLNTTSYDDGIYTITVHAYKPDGQMVASSSATRTFIINNNHTECDRITDARALEDDTPCLLEGKAVSAGTGSAMDGAFYIEETDRSAGVRVAWTGSTIPTGKKVIFLGTIGDNTSTGERQITAEDVWVSTENAQISPVGLTNIAIGGATPSSEPYTQGITGGVGLYNTGLLVRVWGKVEYVDGSDVYINDGGGLLDGNPYEGPIIVPLDGSAIPTTHPPVKGLRVYFGNLDTPGIGDYVAITGISSTTIINGNIVRCIRPRSLTDIDYIQSYITCHKAQGNTHFLREDGTTIPLGSRVRLVDSIVQINYGTNFKVIHTGVTAVYSFILANTQLLPYTQQFAKITVIGTTIEGDSYSNGDKIVADCIYLGGSNYGAMRVEIPGAESMMSLDQETESANGLTGETQEYRVGTFRPWPYPTAEEILASDWFNQLYYREGAIGWALSQPDDTVIDLLGEHVTKEWYDGRVFTVKEAFEPGLGELLLYLDEPVEGLSNHMYSIDIIGGTMTTLPNGQRAVVRPEAVYVYTDRNGHYMFAIPWFKWICNPINSLDGSSSMMSVDDPFDIWPWKVQIAP